MSNKYSYNRTGAERKALVDTVSRILEKPAVYLGAPTFAYAVGDYRVSKKGSLFCLNNISQEEIERLVLRLQEQGFIAETSAEEDSPAGELQQIRRRPSQEMWRAGIQKLLLAALIQSL